MKDNKQENWRVQPQIMKERWRVPFVKEQPKDYDEKRWKISQADENKLVLRNTGGGIFFFLYHWWVLLFSFLW